jgi:hypothetical protein
MVMPNIAVYAGGPLGPDKIATNLANTRSAGWTTIIIGLFHIGRPDIPGQQYGDIIFGGAPMVIQNGKYVLPDYSWPEAIAALKGTGSSITQIYASFGGGGPVFDYTSLQTIYEQNGNSFAGTAVERNFQLFRQIFSAVDGIDLDCEDNYDPPSFNAFCKMLVGMGFALTFCPYTYESFWVNALSAIQTMPNAPVAWWNLQCYDGGTGNDPQLWANAITAKMGGFPIEGFVLAGADAGSGPQGVQSLISGFAREPALGGGFIWNLDEIFASGSSQADYVSAVRNAMSATKAAHAPAVAPSAKPELRPERAGAAVKEAR